MMWHAWLKFMLFTSIDIGKYVCYIKFFTVNWSCLSLELFSMSAILLFFFIYRTYLNNMGFSLSTLVKLQINLLNHWITKNFYSLYQLNALDTGTSSMVLSHLCYHSKDCFGYIRQSAPKKIAKFGVSWCMDDP